MVVALDLTPLQSDFKFDVIGIKTGEGTGPLAGANRWRAKPAIRLSLNV